MRFLIALDQLLNVILGGEPSLTLSARIFIKSFESQRWMRVMRIVDYCFFWENNHCALSFLTELNLCKTFLTRYSHLEGRAIQ